MRWSLLRLVMALVLVSVRLAHAEATQALQLVTGDLPPYAIQGHPDRPGLHVEIIEQVLQRAGQPAKVAFYPWARSIALTQHTPRTAILPLTRTPEREQHYKWLMKLNTQHFVFINRSNEPPITTLEQARKLRIVILRGSPNLAQLLNRQFSETQVIQVARVEEMIRMVERGMADALYGGNVINMEKIRSSGRNPADFQTGMLVESADMWLAGGKGFDEAEQLAWRQAYDSMVKDGTLARLYRAYQVPMP